MAAIDRRNALRIVLFGAAASAAGAALLTPSATEALPIDRGPGLESAAAVEEAQWRGPPPRGRGRRRRRWMCRWRRGRRVCGWEWW